MRNKIVGIKIKGLLFVMAINNIYMSTYKV